VPSPPPAASRTRASRRAEETSSIECRDRSDSAGSITTEKAAVLQFGGGCQGCAAVDITLKNSVEVTLLERVPELTAVLDQTDHTFTENAYYS